MLENISCYTKIKTKRYFSVYRLTNYYSSRVLQNGWEKYWNSIQFGIRTRYSCTSVLTGKSTILVLLHFVKAFDINHIYTTDITRSGKGTAYLVKDRLNTECPRNNTICIIYYSVFQIFGTLIFTCMLRNSGIHNLQMHGH